MESSLLRLVLLIVSSVATWRANGETFKTKSCKLECTLYNKTVLDCQGKQCHEIPVELPNDDITELWLQNNNITQIIKISQNLGGLTRLHLQNNNINDIEEQAFEQCMHLQYLNISHNQLTKMRYAHLSDLNNLITLDLSSNKLTYLEPAFITFTNMKRLQELSLQNNQIDVIAAEAFTDLEDLRRVDLSFNSLSHIDARNFDGLSGLEYLNLCHNFIQSLKMETFQDCPKLKTLILSHNVIADIHPTAFQYANNIRDLDLSYNSLATLPRDLILPSVQSLLLDNNNLISDITGEFFGDNIGGQLKNLSISNCQRLKYVRKGAFTGLRNLRNLYMHDNANLQLIERGAFNDTQTSIKVVILRNNRLQNLWNDTFNWPYLHDLDLSFNPWNCDCHLEWVIEKDIYSKHWGDTKCKYPSILSGLEVRKVPWQNYTCSARAKAVKAPLANRAFLIVLLATSTVFVIGISIILYYNRRQICGRSINGKFHYVSLYNAKDPSLDGAVTVQYTEDDEKTALTAPTQV